MSINISDINSPDRSFQNNAQPGNTNLKNGDIIRAKVTGKLPDGGILISANGRQLNVVTGLNLPEGSRHLFQVNLIGSKIELRLLEGTAPKSGQPVLIMPPNASGETLTGILSELKTALDQAGLNRTAAQALNNLKQIMPSIQYGNPRDHNGMWIKQNILSSGLFWENKVVDFLSEDKSNPIKKIMKGDLKAILLSLQKGLMGEDNDGNDALTMKVKQALNLIEGNQQLNLSTLEQGLGWLFVIPGLEDAFSNAELFVKKGDGKNGIFFSLLLEFTQLGRLEANVSMIESRTSIKILMDDEEKTGIVNDNLPLLEAGLKALGMADVKVSCDVRNGDTVIGSLSPTLSGRSKTVNIVI
jgi:hypothetical protein